jgi:hypothetical protein
MSEATHGALDALLDRVHAAVRAGDLAALAPLAAEMAAAAQALAVTGAAAQALRQKAARNAACLEATARGLRAAQRRLREIAAAAAGGSVYDGRGRARAMSAAAGRMAARL